ncbi:elongation factor P maturation arginine rhamnosyltransferase EarP [uncultured Shewanella sp.]|uniref:elongation factor P maturation arginine rhamnosyltransferase EarP n=1 Tax=uncultured Shewanella sp. TaxID=173975 RepID=UPI002605727A|nr:elongation factor P maturation arginine rhamnosyltransferase EarP [uncultured Shewanella sp.]
MTPSSTSLSPHWDIFCTVIDNFGDIGVTWRLAKQLSTDFGIQVTLWVDCLDSFQCILPSLDAQLTTQEHQGITIEHWQTPLKQTWKPGRVLIEAFACELPDSVIHERKTLAHPPLWINLDYLTAEAWIDDCHGLPSLLSDGQQRFFFFPGFSPKSGGLLCEKGLFERQTSWLNNPHAQHDWLTQLGFTHLATKNADATYISVFSYATPALTALSQHWQQDSKPIHLLVPHGKSLDSLQWMLSSHETHFITGNSYHAGNLHVHVLPMTSQEEFDKLLWYCDLNIVRGEDSFLRAQWAQKPFIWHIYPQEDNVHIDKLTAFMTQYCASLDSEATQCWQALCLAFNEDKSQTCVDAWLAFVQHNQTLKKHAEKWPKQALNAGDLATRLVNFVKKS